MTTSVTTSVKNTSGVEKVFGFLPPHGRTLAVNETVEFVGDIFASIATNVRKLRALQRAVDAADLVILSTPSRDDDTARDYLTGRQFQQQFIDNITDVYGITLSAGAGSVITTVGITDSATREPIPFTDVVKVGLKMITNNDGSAVVKINGTTVVAGGITVEANLVDGKAAFTISVTGATGGGTVLTFDSQDVESNGLGTDTATVTIT